MNPIEWIASGLGAAMVCLDTYAIRKILVSDLYSPGQRWMQIMLILLVPILGASLAIYLCRSDIQLFQKPPVDHVGDIDPTCTDIDYHG